MLMSVEYSVSKLIVISKEQVMGILIPIEGSIESRRPNAYIYVFIQGAGGKADNSKCGF